MRPAPNIDVLGETDSIDEQMYGAFSGPVEFFPGFGPRPQISHVIFDFDGTLSWLRHGWPEIMCRLFLEHVKPRPGETEQSLHDRLLTDLLALNGKPAIYQMQLGAELAAERGEPAPDPKALLDQYHDRLDRAVHERMQQIRAGATPDGFVVHGARDFLRALHQRGLTLIILSGTVEPRVREEAALLGLTPYFGNHIYGSRTDLAQWSKADVVERLFRDEGIRGEHLLSFGDGPVEIAVTKQAGGLAIGVASDEEVNGSGKLDEFKRRQLVAAGADAVIADYRDGGTLMSALLKP